MRTPSSILLAVFLTGSSVYALEFGPPVPVADVARTAPAPFTVRSVVPDGKGGSVAFGRMASSGTQRTDIVAIRIDANGTPRWDNPVVIAMNQSPFSQVAAAKKNDGGYLVTYSDAAGDGHVAPLDEELTAAAAPQLLPKEEPYPLACSGGTCAGIAANSLLLFDASGKLAGRISMPGARSLAAVAGGFAIGASESREVQVVRFIDFNGTTTATAVLPASGNSFYAPTVAAHPLGAAAFWPSNNHLDAAIVRADGTVVSIVSLHPAGFAISELAAAVNASGEYGLAFISILQSAGVGPPITTTFVMRLSATFETLTDPTTVSVDGPNDGPVIAAAGNNFVAAWRSSFEGADASYMAFMPADGPIAASVPLALAPASQTGRAVAASASRILALWSTPAVSGGYRLYAARFSQFGTRLDATPIEIAHAASGGAASDGHDFVVNTGTQVVEIDGDSGAKRVLIAQIQSSSASIAWDGAGYLLPLFVDGGGYKLMRIAPDGTTLWTRNLGFQYTEGLAAIPGRTLAVGRRDGGIGYHLFDAAGSPIAAGVIAVSPTASVADLVSNRRDEFLLFLRDSNGTFAMRIGAGGALIDPAPVQITALPANGMAAAPLGNHWVLMAGNRAIEFPGGTATQLPFGETPVDAAGASGGRAVLLTSHTELIEDRPVTVLAVREVRDPGWTPPRRRSVKP